MKKTINWLKCDSCHEGGIIEITTDMEVENTNICYEGDIAECKKCNKKGEIYIETDDNTAHVAWGE